MKSIDLGNSPSEYGMPVSSAPMEHKPNYPMFHFTVSEEVEVPDSGTMTVTFRRKEKTEREDDRGERYTFCLEIKSIDKITESEEDAPPARNLNKDTENALRKLKAEKEAEVEDEGEEEE